MATGERGKLLGPLLMVVLLLMWRRGINIIDYKRKAIERGRGMMSVKWEFRGRVQGDSHLRGGALVVHSIVYSLFWKKIYLHPFLIYCFH